MNSKSLRRRLENMGYRLGKDIFGWVVTWPEMGFTWKFPTLRGVNQFVTDEENLAKHNAKKGG